MNASALVLFVGLLAVGGGLACRSDSAPSVPSTTTSNQPPPSVRATRVVSLGRIRASRTVRVAGPARPSVVVGRLHVDQGDQVELGALLAELDSVPTEQAEVQVWRAEVANAEQDLRRARNLHEQGVGSRAVYDQAVARRTTAAARLEQAMAELERSHVRAPISGLVLEVFARDGERVGPDGIVEIADTSRMLAVAEVPESDIGSLRPGQPARVSSPSVAAPLTGRVVRLGSKVRQQEVVNTDAAARLDARVVEVEIELDDPAAVAALTNLRVEVEIDLIEGKPTDVPASS